MFHPLLHLTPLQNDLLHIIYLCYLSLTIHFPLSLSLLFSWWRWHFLLSMYIHYVIFFRIRLSAHWSLLFRRREVIVMSSLSLAPLPLLLLPSLFWLWILPLLRRLAVTTLIQWRKSRVMALVISESSRLPQGLRDGLVGNRRLQDTLSDNRLATLKLPIQFLFHNIASSTFMREYAFLTIYVSQPGCLLFPARPSWPTSPRPLHPCNNTWSWIPILLPNVNKRYIFNQKWIPSLMSSLSVSESYSILPSGPTLVPSIWFFFYC